MHPCQEDRVGHGFTYFRDILIQSLFVFPSITRIAFAIPDVETPSCLAISAIEIPHSRLNRQAILARSPDTLLFNNDHGS